MGQSMWMNILGSKGGGEKLDEKGLLSRMENCMFNSNESLSTEIFNIVGG